MLFRKINPKVGAIIIFSIGVLILIYGATTIDWTNIEISFKAVFFPILFLLIVSLFCAKILNIKDVAITKEKTDEKIYNSIVRFDQKTKVIQVLIMAFILFAVITNLILHFYDLYN